MDGLGTGRRIACVLASLVIFGVLVDRAEALEAFDGRIEAHGFVEIQVRTLDRSFEEEMNLSQWYNVFNLELEFDILPDGWGPFDLLQAYIRAEARYDCIYTGGCGMFPSVQQYGNNSRDLPLRLRDGKTSVYSGVIDMTEVADPPGRLALVPGNPGNPVRWSLQEVEETPATPDVRTDPNTYDENLFSGCPPTRAPSTAQENPVLNPVPNEAGCIDNRPTTLQTQKRRAFPGFDTLFDLKGADSEIGDYQDYAAMNARGEILGLGPNSFYNPAIRDPEYEIPDVGGYISTYGPLFRGFALANDDPAAYALEPVLDWRFTFRSYPGPLPGGQVLPMGPWRPENYFKTLAALADRAHPLRGRQAPNLLVVDGKTEHAAGTRYHELDCGKPVGAGGAIINCDDPSAPNYVEDVDPFPEDLTILQELGKIVGGQITLSDPTLDETLAPDGQFYPGTNLNITSEYPYNSFFNGVFGNPQLASQGIFTDLFGGDYSGNIPCWDTNKTIGNRRNLPTNSYFIDQLSSAQIVPAGGPNPIGLGRFARAGCVPFTNVRITGGTGELPMRAAPDFSNLSKLEVDRAQGIYIPSWALIDYLEGGGEFDPHEFNISQADRAWNRGASQRETYELKEAYLDLEFLESRLWIRAGIQNIVWGKTELFRTTDQFNPQDFALSSLPALEESRIALLSWRAVYSFYDVGPLEDVRFELAMNFDRFKPTDLGACGEPYTLDVVCALTLGTAIHSVTGLGVAGFDRPDAGWESVDGLEFGGRVEFRWDRFSFAIIDYYGYSDFPYPDVITYYDRNVDATTGKPRKGGASGPCANGAGFLVTNIWRDAAPTSNDNKVIQGGNYEYELEIKRQLRELKNAPVPDQSAITRAEEALKAVKPTGFRDVFASGELDPNIYQQQLLAAEDDWWRRKEAVSLMGIGTDESCLKPGGAPGQANANQFDPALAPSSAKFFGPNPDFELYSNANAPLAEGDTYKADTYIATTLGLDPTGATVQWNKSGSSVDYALRHHPANQQLFGFICSATVTIAVALAPNACAWNIWGTEALLLQDTDGPPFGDLLGAMLSGPTTTQFYQRFFNTILINTKGRGMQNPRSIPMAPLSSDAGDGRTTSVSTGYGINFRGIANVAFVGPEKFLKDTPRDFNDLLTLDNSLTVQQKAQLGCGPHFGTRCDSGTAVVRVRIKDCAGRPLLPYATQCGLWQNIVGSIDIEAERTALSQPELYDIVDKDGAICPADDLTQCRIWGRGGGIDFQMADASVILQSFIGIEGTDKRTNTPLDFSEWVTWAADTPQPGTIGLVGLKGFDDLDREPTPFEGPPNCTRYDKKNPLANKKGVVLQPGCRGAVSATVNRRDINNLNDNTVDVIYDEGYDPMVDGCTFGSSMRIRTIFGNETYWVRAVNPDGETVNQEVNNALYETCFNSNAPEIARVAPGTPGIVAGTDSRTNTHWRDPTWYSYTRGSVFDGPPGVPREWISQLYVGSGHRFHPTAQCEQAGPGNDNEPVWRPNPNGDTPEQRVRTAVGLCTTVARDYESDFIKGNASVFKNELGAVSSNMQTFLVTTSCNKISATDDLAEKECFDPNLPWAVGRCSFSTPNFCRNVRGFLGVGGVQRNDPRAGGNSAFGRRTFIWQGGADLALKYKRRNVFGISADFAEDNTKTNWGVEFTYISPTPWIDNNSYTSTTDSSAVNLTVSIDRPTFINFLNANRTFFFNTQWFFNYLPNWNKGFTTFGDPFNVLFTFAVFTGYYQDRLLPQLVTVYDFGSQSAGFLPQLGYRFTEAFSVTFGVSFFVGRNEYVRMPVRGFAPPTNRAGPHKYEDGVNRLLANFMRRDEFWMRLRWTF